MDWWDLALKLLPALTALLGAFVGAVIGPLIARKASLDTAKLNLEGQRLLAQEAAARAEETAVSQERRDLLEPLLTAARQDIRDVETYIYAGTGEPPERRAILREDLRWSAVPSRRFDTALRRYRAAKNRLGMALHDEANNRDGHSPSQGLLEAVGGVKTAVLLLHDAAEAYVREGPDT